MGDLRNLAEQALRSMAHRTMASSDGNQYQNLVRSTKTSSILGGFPTEPADLQDDLIIHGRVYYPKNIDLRSWSKKIEEHDLSSLASELETVDGAYAFVHPSDDALIVGRDPLGVKPLYMARNENGVGVASEAKALTSVGLSKVVSIPPGVYEIHLDYQKRYEIRSWKRTDQIPTNMDEASTKVLELLTDAVHNRLSEERRICVGFSGGLDSSLLALLVSKQIDPDLVTVCTEGSYDQVEAEKAARQLDLSLTVRIVDKAIVSETLKSLPYLIESHGLMDLGISMALHLAAKEAHKMNCRCLMLGQLADELFGGYGRYLRLYQSQGREYVHDALCSDVLNAYHTNFERDDKAASPYAELNLPYASTTLVDYAMRLPPELKINTSQEIRKTVLRKAAVKAGLPDDIAFGAKKAVQFSSGLQKMIKRLSF